MKSPKDIEKEWWDRWWEQDWSWDGDDFKKPVGNGTAPQVYVSSEANSPHTIPSVGKQAKLYVDPITRKQYTRFHLPLTWSDRTTPTPKASWTDADHRNVANHLGQLLKNHQGTDHAAPFKGMVLKKVPDIPDAGKTDRRYREQDKNYKAVLNQLREYSPENVFPNKLTLPVTVLNDGDDTSRRDEAVTVCFDDAWLRPRRNWLGRSFRSCSFHQTFFSEKMSFEAATFIDAANFDSAIFSSTCDFGLSTFRCLAHFEQTTFGSQAEFKSSTFGAEAKFKEAIFHGKAEFSGSHFHGDIDFEGPDFYGILSLVDAHFHDSADAKGLSFKEATFHSDVLFQPKVFPTATGYAQSAFSGARFDRRANFDAKAFFAPAAFDGAVLERGIRLYKDHIDPPDRRTPKIMKQYVELASGEDELLRSIADGARTLQGAMAQARHTDAEQLFHRLEVMARRKRLKTGWWPPSKWGDSFRALLTYAYAYTSDYGGSIIRPLFSLFVVWFICGVSYWTIHTGFVKSCLYFEDKTPCAWAMEVEGESSWADAFTFSSTATFRPFYVWTLNDERSGGAFADKLLFGDQDADAKTGAREFWVKLLATAQSLFSIVMLFLSGLAARRYYQVS